MIAVVALLGALTGLAATAAALALTPRPTPADASHRTPDPTSGWTSLHAAAVARWRPMVSRAGAAVACAALVGGLTRWPVGAVLAGIGAGVLPAMLGTDRTTRAILERTEAVAVWAEMLRDSLSAAAGLEQTILLTAPFAPPAIHDEVNDLAAALRLGTRLGAALDVFGARIEDPTGRLVARALAQAGRSQSRQLPDLLSELARRARERANLHLRIAPGHARIRANTRIIVGFTLALAAGLVLLNREFLRPYDSGTGQLVLLAVAAVFAAGFLGLTRLTRASLPSPATTRAGAARPGTTSPRVDDTSRPGWSR